MVLLSVENMALSKALITPTIIPHEAPGSEDDGDGRFDLSPLTQEELETLRALLDKASRLDG